MRSCQFCQRYTACQEYDGFWLCEGKCWPDRYKIIAQVRKNHPDIVKELAEKIDHWEEGYPHD